ncbi:MAG: hypothetical protein ACP5I8_08500 [Phycisphaerae bacterium]
MGIAVGWGANDCISYVEAFFPGAPGIRVAIGGRYYAKAGDYGVIFEARQSQNGAMREATLGATKLGPSGTRSTESVDVVFIPHDGNFDASAIGLDYWCREKIIFLTDVGLKGHWLTKAVTKHANGVTRVDIFVRFHDRWTSGGQLRSPYFDYKGVQYRYDAASGHWVRLGNETEMLGH